MVTVTERAERGVDDMPIWDNGRGGPGQEKKKKK